MKQLLITIGLFVLTQVLLGQESEITPATPYIEVVGKAEKTIVPDEIYLSITIKERESGRDKVSIGQQEEKLKNALKELSIPIENLSVSDAQADYIRIKWSKKDVVSQSEYELKLENATQVAKVLEKLDKLKIDNVYITRVSHSKIVNYWKEVRIMAIKAGKEKADYLLEAIGQKTGSAIIVKEISPNLANIIPGMNVRGSRDDGYETYIYGQTKFSSKITFKKIKLESNIYLKFEIE
jgi:uncharacterized protein